MAPITYYDIPQIFVQLVFYFTDSIWICENIVSCTSSNKIVKLLRVNHCVKQFCLLIFYKKNMNLDLKVKIRPNNLSFLISSLAFVHVSLFHWSYSEVEIRKWLFPCPLCHTVSAMGGTHVFPATDYIVLGGCGVQHWQLCPSAWQPLARVRKPWKLCYTSAAVL